MTTRYVGPGGSDANNGLSWANRKLTLNGVEDSPVAAGDVVYVGPGVYREMLTLDVSGSAGNPITYIGDYDGSHTDGVGGVVRITGSDDDQTVTRASGVTGSSKNYRTFQGFHFDMVTTGSHYNPAGSNQVIEDCYFGISNNNAAISITSGTALTVRRCCFINGGSGSRYGVSFNNGTAVNNAGHVVENCLFVAVARGVDTARVGGITIRNSLFYSVQSTGVRVSGALTAGQTVTVNNCIFVGCNVALMATTTAEFVENYNALFANTTDRTSVSTGANSNTLPWLPDSRWFFEMVGGGAMVTPFDMAGYSALVNVAGTSPPSADMRGTTVQGAQREWGALEFDSTLDIEVGSGAGIYRRVARTTGR